MKILLLGATGLLGHNVLRQLLLDGHEVAALVRHPDKLLFRHERLEAIQGATDAACMESAACGCDAIINCAGTTDMALRHYEDYLAMNATICKEMIEIMEHHGISTLVHTSTANTIGYGTPEEPADEEQPIQAPFSQSFYALSKQLGESYLATAAEQHPDWHIVVVNPGFMIGAYDTKPSSGVLLLTGYRKPIMAAPRGGKSFVAASDAARAIANALTMGRHGERYLLTGENMTLREFYHLQATVMGYRQGFISLPNWLVGLAGKMGDALRWCGIRTQLSTRNVRQLMVTEHYDNGRATRELMMPHTPVEEAVKAFFEWWGNKKGKNTLEIGNNSY